MKIVLISNYRLEREESMLRYARMLERRLTARGHTVKLVQPPVVLGRMGLPPGPLAKWVGYVDRFLLAPLFLRRQCRGADVVHVCDHSNSMYLRAAGRTPAVLTCHDLLAINSMRGRYEGIRVSSTGRVMQRWIESGVRSAKHVVCVSNKTREELQQLGPAAGAQLTVIHHPLNVDYRPAERGEIARALAVLGLAPETRYFFHVGGNGWYKNRLGVMKLFAALRRLPEFQRTRLVMAGAPWTAELQEYNRSQFAPGEVVEAAGPSDRELQALYSGALALLFPSREEGFGWPILEAQACGCPVVTSDRAPMPEIAGDAAVLIDPEQPEKAAELIRRSVPRFAELRKLGFKNLERFSAERAIDAYLRVYREAAGVESGPVAAAGEKVALE